MDSRPPPRATRLFQSLLCVMTLITRHQTRKTTFTLSTNEIYLFAHLPANSFSKCVSVKFFCKFSFIFKHDKQYFSSDFTQSTRNSLSFNSPAVCGFNPCRSAVRQHASRGCHTGCRRHFFAFFSLVLYFICFRYFTQLVCR